MGLAGIKCPALKGEHISPLRCRMKQREDSKFWGAQSKRMTGCPCEQGGEMATTKMGTCPKCNRPDMPLYGFKGEDVCGTCKNHHYRKIKKCDSPDPKVSARAPARKPDTAPDPAAESKPTPRPSPSHTFTTLPRRSDPFESIFLNFAEEDQDLLHEIMTDAKRHRRQPDQHILWMLESYLVFTREINAGAMKGVQS